MRGNLEILKWAKENDCPWEDNVYDLVCRFGSSKMVMG